MTDTVRCVECRHYTLKRVPERARQGLGTCALGKHYQFPSPSVPRQCAKFVKADDAIVTGRVRWLGLKTFSVPATPINLIAITGATKA